MDGVFKDIIREVWSWDIRVEMGAVTPLQPILTPNNDSLTRVD